MADKLDLREKEKERQPSSKSADVFVEQTFTFRGEQVHHTVVQAQEPARIIPDPTSQYGYTGKCDGGVLPEPREGGPHGFMLAALEQAKEDASVFLTNMIEEEKQNKTKPN